MTVSILQGDALATLRGLPAGQFQTCVSSPPYFGLRSYLPDGHPDKALEVGSEESPDAFVERLVEIYREVRRVLRPDGTAWLNIADSHAARTPKSGDWPVKPKDLMLVPFRLALALQADGWWVRQDVIWHKTSAFPESVEDRPTTAHVHVFLLTASARYFYDATAIREPHSQDSLARVQRGRSRRHKYLGGGPGHQSIGEDLTKACHPLGRNSRSVWPIASEGFSGLHFATMPSEIARRCIAAGTSEAGQCPHCGSAWGRMVEKRLASTAAVSYGTVPDLRDECADPGDQGSRRVRMGHVPGLVRADVTLGWRPSCSCPEHEPVPQHVLDPFLGAGTTALVAAREGRHCCGIELSASYVEMARQRLVSDAPLFMEVA